MTRHVAHEALAGYLGLIEEYETAEDGTQCAWVRWLTCYGRVVDERERARLGACFPLVELHSA